MKKTFQLDFVGDAFKETLASNNLGTFSLTAHLKEKVQTENLAMSAKALGEKIPYFNGRMNKSGCYELIEESLKIQPAANYHDLDTLVKITYCDDKITMETSHLIMDGRALSEGMALLLSLYFNQGATTPVVLEKNFESTETIEDAYERFANEKKSETKPKASKKKAYKHDHLKLMGAEVHSETFDLSVLKEEAAKLQLTIGEYLLTQIFSAMAAERNEAGSKKPIVADVPVDFRSFFPTKTLRNFIGNLKVAMPETRCENEMAIAIRTQFSELNQGRAQDSVNENQIGKTSLAKLPPKIKKLLLKTVSNNEKKRATFMFSNLGKLDLPAEIMEQIHHLEFYISPTPGLPYTFSCISLGNTLTLNVTKEVEGTRIINQVMKNAI